MDDITKKNESEELIENTTPPSEDVSDDITPETLKAIVEVETADAEAERKAMPSPETARLTYSAYADMKPCRESVYAPIGIFNYIGILLLTGIPAVGFIIAVIYVLASKKLARRRLATAIVILQTVLCTLVGAAVAVAVLVYNVDIVKMWETFISNFTLN